MAKLPPKAEISPEDRALFRQTIKGTRPLQHEHSVSISKKASPKTIVIKQKKKLTPIPTQEKCLAISDQISGTPVTASEYLCFTRTGFSSRNLRKLKQGNFPIEATLDLHGMNTDTARSALLQFVAYCIDQGSRHVIIIHGKGRASADNAPILKNRVNTWLRQHPQVLAFCSAKPQVGGTGAIYLLLKRKM